MNENPNEANAEDQVQDDSSVNTNGSTLEHGDQTFQPDDEGATTDVDFTAATTEMPESEIEPPTMGDQAAFIDVGNDSSVPETYSDTLEEPREEVDLATQETPTVDVLTSSSTEDLDKSAANGRVPFHANEIHESTQPVTDASEEASNGLDDAPMTDMDMLSEPIAADEAVATTMFAEPTTEPMTTSTSLPGMSSQDLAAAAPVTLVDTPVSKKRGFWSKKRTVVAIIIAVIIVIIAGGAAFAYKAWYQAPSKVLSDAALNFVSAKSMTYSGTLTVKDSMDNFNVSFNGGLSGDTVNSHIDATLKAGDTSIEVPLDIVAQNSTLYFKLSNLQKLESQFLSPYLMLMGGASQKQVDGLVKSIDGTWYKVTPSDLNESSKDKQTNTCVSDIFNKIRTDKSTQNEIMSVYKNHPLFTLQKELGSKNGSLGYELTPVTNKGAAEFAKAFQGTSIYKSLIKCDSSLKSMFSTSGVSANDTTPVDGSVQIWVSRWDHQITKVTASSDENGTRANFTFVPKVGDETAITIPNNAKSIDDLKRQFTSFEQSMEAQMNVAQQNGPPASTSNVEAIVQ